MVSTKQEKVITWPSSRYPNLLSELKQKTFLATEDTEITENRFLKFQCLPCFPWLLVFPLSSLCLRSEFEGFIA